MPKTTAVEPLPAENELAQWQALIADADTVLGRTLVDTADLVGVPFIITRVTYREGILRQGADWRDDYVSCEATIPPEIVLEAARIDPATLTVEPGEDVVFNDGSTGIYRQITAYLHDKGFITLREPLKVDGNRRKGESSYDLPREYWADGAEGASEGIDIRLYAKRGIRISEYENDYTSDGRTAYLA